MWRLARLRVVTDRGWLRPDAVAKTPPEPSADTEAAEPLRVEVADAVPVAAVPEPDEVVYSTVTPTL